MNILYLSAHSILEYDEISLFHDLGHTVFSLGSYFRPSQPMDSKRPPLPQMQEHLELIRMVESLPNLGRDKLPGELVEWADCVIVAANPIEWVQGNWETLCNKRTIWRTIGQSNVNQEAAMRVMHSQGLQIVRYSPAEKRFFEAQGSFAGEDAMIRFYKDPEEFKGWTGERAEVGQVSQHHPEPHGRDAFTNWKYFEAATMGLPTSFAGPNSEKIGGLGCLDYDAMKAYLRSIRAYCYTGTCPASYTLGFIEALMTGVPIVSITKKWMWSGPELFEADELAFCAYDDPLQARLVLRTLLLEPDLGASFFARTKAIELFGKQTIMRQWEAFLR